MELHVLHVYTILLAEQCHTLQGVFIVAERSTVLSALDWNFPFLVLEVTRSVPVTKMSHFGEANAIMGFVTETRSERCS